MNRIALILSEIRPETDFGSSENFVSDGLLDSFDIIQLVNALEGTFKICIPGEMILPENFASIQSIHAIVSELSGAREAI